MTERLSDERLLEVAEFDNGDWIATDMLLSIAEAASMARELITARTLCCEVYQVVGALASVAGVFATPEVARVLDNLISAISGEPLPHETLIPFEVKAAGPVMPDVPSDEVVQAAFASADIPQEDIDAEARADFCVFWGDARAALLKEQGRG